LLLTSLIRNLTTPVIRELLWSILLASEGGGQRMIELASRLLLKPGVTS